jgi:hypothetical protein
MTYAGCRTSLFIHYTATKATLAKGACELLGV